MVDISSDRLVNLNEAAKLLGRRVAASTWGAGNERESAAIDFR